MIGQNQHCYTGRAAIDQIIRKDAIAHCTQMFNKKMTAGQATPCSVSPATPHPNRTKAVLPTQNKLPKQQIAYISLPGEH